MGLNGRGRAWLSRSSEAQFQGARNAELVGRDEQVESLAF
jgi:hypothetical protein